MKACILSFILGLSVIGLLKAQTPAQTVPEFSFSRMDNTPFTHKDLPKGKILCFIFFDPDCDHCQHAIKNIEKQFAHFQKTAVYLVSVADKDKIDYFLSSFAPSLKKQKNVWLLRDPESQFLSTFKPIRYPGMFLYGADGKLLDYEDNAESVFRLVNAINKISK
jgi:hypothetical protein